MGRAGSLLGMLLLGLLATSCGKVPLVDIGARFTLADATWYAQEETLFLFYRVEARQGLGPDTRVELTFRTDTVELPWTALSELTPVHTHVPVDCGSTQLCGSLSLHVADVPRLVGVRLRYHREGDMVLDTPLTFNVVGPGPAHTHRSLLVYGVFDEANSHVQWRARHQFPTLRNEDVQGLGLRRSLRIEDARHGVLEALPPDNPYGYAMAPACPGTLAPLDSPALETNERAIFDGAALPLSASTSSGVCARSTVTDARGTYEAVALARKNPEVSPAFPLLRSPVRVNTQVGFLLRPCRRTLSELHLAMQVQRLQLEGAEEVCIDDWRQEGFSGQLASLLRARIDAVRTAGNDMVLTLALHHDESGGQLGAAVEQALLDVLLPERDKSSPRVSGAFVLDSVGYSLTRSQLARMVVWCPARMPLGEVEPIPAEGLRSCPVMPDLPDITFGPLRMGNLPILVAREQYLRFIEKYSEAQAGRVRSLAFRAPTRTPLSQNVPLGEFGVATFFNNEVLTAEPTDVFSYCQPTEAGASAVVFRAGPMPEPVPLAMLPEVHELAQLTSYPLGLAWDFPFLSRMEYEVVVAGAVSAYGLTVPFGVGTPSEAYYGTPLWETGEFPLHDVLLRCARFCEHPTFDSAGVYNVGAGFRTTYRAQCYRPRYPAPGDGGFPLDP